MKLTKEQISQIIGIVISAVIALLAVFGYDVGVVQPRFVALQAQIAAQIAPMGAQAVLGNTYEALNVTKQFKSFGTADMSKATVTDLTGTTITATTLISTAVGFDTTGNGTAAAPAYTFASDPDTGIYRVGANDIGVATNGTLAFDVSATAATSALPLVLPVGSAAAPAGTFTGDTDTGIYRVGANDIGISAGGTLRFDVSATAATLALPLVLPVGSAAAPAGTFTGDTDTGIYRVGANNIGVATNGVLAFDVSATAVTFALPAIFSSESITPADGGTLTITANFVTLTPAGALGTALAACTSGQTAVVYNSIAANVVITDTGNGVLAGNQTLGQYDALPLACFGLKWVQVGPVSAN